MSALARLKDAADQPKDEYLRDSVIQRFEFTYELAWKLLKLLLASKDMVVYSPLETLRASLQQGWIDDGDAWTALHKMRNLTTHTYNISQAELVYDFITEHGIALFELLAEKLPDTLT